MENLSQTPPGDPGAHPDKPVLAVLTKLEQELGSLDRLGAHIAAAHLDAAIQQLRADLAHRAKR